MKTALLILVGLLALELPAPVPQDRPPEFVLGVLRLDGIVTPFATFDGRRWRTRWPEDVRNRELPISLDAVPESWWDVDTPPRAMTLWRDAERKGSITLTDVTMSTPMCERRITLESDYKAEGPVPPPFEHPYPKAGLVVSADITIEPIQVVEKGSADWNAAVILITEEFNRQETAAARSFTDWTHPYDERRRKAVPITMEAVYRAPTEDPKWTAYYIEAARQYPPGPKDKDGCGLSTFTHGWLLTGPGKEARVHLSAKVAYCDRKGASYMLPFGLFRADDKVYWIYQFSGFEEEWYEVVEPKRGGIDSHVAYRAGFCPQ